jgi:hypothetical protein
MPKTCTGRAAFPLKYDISAVFLGRSCHREYSGPKAAAIALGGAVYLCPATFQSRRISLKKKKPYRYEEY